MYFSRQEYDDPRSGQEDTVRQTVMLAEEFLGILITILSKYPVIKLTYTTLWANLWDNKLMIVVFFPENKLWHFMQTVSRGDSLHKISKPVF